MVYVPGTSFFSIMKAYVSVRRAVRSAFSRVKVSMSRVVSWRAFFAVSLDASLALGLDNVLLCSDGMLLQDGGAILSDGVDVMVSTRSGIKLFHRR
jgi:hypothetical protein